MLPALPEVNSYVATNGDIMEYIRMSPKDIPG